MTKTIRALVIGAALAGLATGTTLRANDEGSSKAAAGKKAHKSKKEKHACKGQNSCKGKGGCGANKGKNDCKGQGGCSTDPKHPMPKEG